MILRRPLQIGFVDRMGGEFGLGNQPRDWFLPGKVPGTLTFTIGSSHEPRDWFYAQTQVRVIFSAPFSLAIIVIK